MAQEEKEKEKENHMDLPICPLTPGLLRLIQDAVALGTTNNKELARLHHCLEETVKSIFYRINMALNTHSRSEAVIKAIAHKWVQIKDGNAPV